MTDDIRKAIESVGQENNRVLIARRGFEIHTGRIEFGTRSINTAQLTGATEMSYSFSVTAKTKAEAKQEVAKQFENILSAQPTHKRDRDTAQEAVEKFIDVASDPTDAQQVQVTVYGSVSVVNAADENADPVCGSASINIAVTVV